MSHAAPSWSGLAPRQSTLGVTTQKFWISEPRLFAHAPATLCVDADAQPHIENTSRSVKVRPHLRAKRAQIYLFMSMGSLGSVIIFNDSRNISQSQSRSINSFHRYLRNPGFGSAAAAVLHPGKDHGCLFQTTNHVLFRLYDNLHWVFSLPTAVFSGRLSSTSL
jgi:hypothetical protein